VIVSNKRVFVLVDLGGNSRSIRSKRFTEHFFSEHDHESRFTTRLLSFILLSLSFSSFIGFLGLGELARGGAGAPRNPR
jgi:hypothetical protein